MEIVLNEIYGSPDVAQGVVTKIREIRKELKTVFASFENKGIRKIKIFLFFNGDVSSYYDGTGLFRPRYSFKKEDFVISFCFDKKEWTDNEISNISHFTIMLKTFLIQCGQIIEGKMRKNKLIFDIKGFEQHIANLFYQA